MTNEAPPCTQALDQDCFKAQPVWAKQAFAYRLLMLITPKQLTRRLSRRLFRLILPPGVDLAPGAELPPGTIVPPGTTVPVGWSTGDPLPPGTIPPGTLPPGTDQTGTTPPLYVAPWEPGPPRRAPGGAVAVTVVTDTFYGSTSDGLMRTINTNWAVARAATTGEDLDAASSTEAAATASLRAGANYHIWRSWLYFDISAIIAGSTITACILNLTSYDNAESILCVQRGTQGDPLTTSDFNNWIGDEFGHVTWALGGGGVPAPNQITFNALGITYLNSVIDGTALLCLREFTYDYSGPSPSPGPPYFRNGMWYQNTATVANRPNLSITYQY